MTHGPEGCGNVRRHVVWSLITNLYSIDRTDSPPHYAAEAIAEGITSVLADYPINISSSDMKTESAALSGYTISKAGDGFLETVG